ncbi:MAG: winged helix-turn-helix domain-containing protein [Candidatus Marinimicrobia bacterium]|nr:winged helix-turn-helix domain-containing protein [Candidatus Neomarinimicrobiota bacterium]
MNVGSIAGKIWKTLNNNGAMTVNALTKELKENSNLVMMGLGWLLREDKLEISKSGNATKYGLKKS